MAYVLVSETLGVYLGESRLPFMTFWSEIDAAPFDEAPCFDSPEAIGVLIRSWGTQEVNFLMSLRPAAVMPDVVVAGRSYASPVACAMAGLPAWLTTATEVPLAAAEDESDAFASDEIQRWQRPTMN